MDGCKFIDIYTSALGSTQANFNVGTSIGTFANNTIDGWIATLGKYAFKWDDTASSGDTICLKIANMRYEQAADTTGATIYISKNAGFLYHLILDQVSLGSTGHGIYIRNVKHSTFRNIHYANGGATRFAVDANDTCSYIVFDNFWMLFGSTFSFANMTRTWAAGRYQNVDTAHPPHAIYEANTGAVINAGQYWDGYVVMGVNTRFVLPSVGLDIQDSNNTGTLARIENSGQLRLLKGGIATPFTTPNKTANYTAAPTDFGILVDSTAGNITISLPDIAGGGIRTGMLLYIKKMVAANNVLLQGAGAQTIDGVNILNIGVAQYSSVLIQANTTLATWHVIAVR